MIAPTTFAATADRRPTVSGFAGLALAQAPGPFCLPVQLPGAPASGAFSGQQHLRAAGSSPREQTEPGGLRANPAPTLAFGEAGSRSQRARATQPSAWSAPDGLLIVMDASQPLAGPTQAGGGHFIAQRHRRFLPA